MPGEIFNSIPWGGRPTHHYMERLQGAAETTGAGFQTLPFAGVGVATQQGLTFIPNEFAYIWAAVEAPADGTLGNGSCGVPHSWTQLVPQTKGCSDEPDPSLFGNTTVNPAYDPNGGFLTTATITKLYPVVRYLANTNQFQQEWWFENPGGSSVQLCRVWGNSVNSGGILYYPSKFNQLNTTTDVWDEGPAPGHTYDCWLVQRFSYPLTTDNTVGGGCYTGERQPGGVKSLTFSNTLYNMPVYATTEYPTIDNHCNTKN